MGKKLQGRVIVCAKCKIPAGLKSTAPIVKVGNVYVHNGACPKVRKQPKRPDIMVPRSNIIVPERSLQKVREAPG